MGELSSAAEHDGLTTMQSRLRGHGRLSAGAAARIVHSGRALEHLPAVAAGCADGAVSAEQVTVVAPVVTAERLAAAAEQDVEVAEVDRALALAAATQTHDELVQIVQGYRAGLDPDGPEPDPTELRTLSLSRHGDGWLSLRGLLDPVDGEK